MTDESVRHRRSRRPRWKPTSKSSLAQAERKILQHIWPKLETRFVPISGKGTRQIRTVIMNKGSEGTPLVMLHGMGAGVGMWALNLEDLSKKRPVYAIDLLGFGRSSRVKFSKKAVVAEEQFVESIEDWRKEIQLEKFILLGHSLGGYIAAAYALRYPDSLQHMVLVDPWGFIEKPPGAVKNSDAPRWMKVAAKVVKPFNPLAGLRAAGPWGPRLVERLRPDLANKFGHLYKDDTVTKYIYHCNAQKPSGEAAFKSMSSLVWAKNPMLNRISEVTSSVPMTMLHGAVSWMDTDVGYQVKEIRNESYVDVQLIEGAGHHVYADQSISFNNAVDRLCIKVDRDLKDRRLSSPIQQVSNV